MALQWSGLAYRLKYANHLRFIDLKLIHLIVLIAFMLSVSNSPSAMFISPLALQLALRIKPIGVD